MPVPVGTRRRLLGGLLLGVLAASMIAASPSAPKPAGSSPTNGLPAARVRSAHWSLQPLRSSTELEAELTRHSTALRPSSPADALGAESVAHPIDAFVQLRLATNGLTLSPPADRLTLIRRLSFDLIGLPPTLAEIDAFVADRSTNAVEHLVDRLLASPHYGERWGRHWLDVARYTESQGFEYDKLRDHAWHYRDYVIRSFNEDKPYDRFMQEQVAGDVLDPVTSDGIIGASLLVCGPWDEAGNAQANATQRAITREEELDDLIGTVGQTFLGLTLNCARCHAHKFDPIPLEEYYRVKSVFEGVKHGERTFASPAEIRARDEQSAAWKAEISAARNEIARLEAEGGKVAAARRQAQTNTPNPAPPGPVPFLRWDFQSAAPAGTADATGTIPFELKGGATIRDGRLQLPTDGAFAQTAPLPKNIREKTLEAWVSLDNLRQAGGAAISIETDDGRVFDAIVFGERQAGKWMAGSSGFERTRDLDAPAETAPPGTLVHLAIAYRSDNSVAVFRNGEAYGRSYTPGSPLQTFPGGRTRVLLGQRHTGGGRPWLTGDIRLAALYDRALSAEEIAASYRSGGFHIPTAEIMASLTDDQRAAHRAALARQQNAQRSLDALKPLPVSYAGTRVQPAPTRVLRRGDVKSPGDIVTPAAISAVWDLDPEFGLPADAPEAERRRRFAHWLADPRNPLPARVMANRIWQFHFGQGLVATPNDFGASGARPTHPELLDWLAAKLIESGWRVKALHRLVLSSRVYQQASVPGPAPTPNRAAANAGEGSPAPPNRSAAEPRPPAESAGPEIGIDAPSGDVTARARALDADNTLLWHYPARRLEAEAVRDAMLAVSGQLNLTMGGPSFRPFDVQKFPANAYVPADKLGPEFSRRTVYRMNVNSGKEPLLDAFDCPDPSVKTPRRGVTTTPLQALALMNNSFVQRQAGHLAERALREAGQDLPQAIAKAYRLTLGRPPTGHEARQALAAARDRSLTNVCWALLNSTEFVYAR